MFDYVEMGKFFRTLRKERNLTLETASAIIDITPKALANIELGKSMPKILTAAKMCDTYGVSLDALFKFYVRSQEASYAMEILHYTPV